MDKKVKELVSKSLIFLVSDNKLDRMTWKKSLASFSAKSENMVIFDDFDKALRAMEERPPKILITSFEIKERSAEVLLAAFRKASPDRSQDLCLIVTESSTRPMRLAKLEYELDDILEKPYNAQDLDKVLGGHLKAKVFLSPEKKSLYRAAAHLRSGEREQAKELMDKYAGEKDGEYNLVQGALDKELGKNEEALEHLKASADAGMGYKALSMLFDLLVSENRCEEAFEASKALIAESPLHPKRLSDYVKVCILTANYHSFVQYATRIAEVGIDDKNYGHQLAAGLAICAKCIGIADHAVAVEASVRAIRLAKDKGNIVERALKTLLDLKEVQLVQELLSELNQEEGLDELLAIAEYRILAFQEESPFLIFQKGMELTNKGVHDFHVYEVLLLSAKKAGRKQESLEEMADNASKHHPEKSDYFRSLVA